MFPLFVHASTPKKENSQVKSEKLSLSTQSKRASWQTADVLPGIVVVKYKEGYSQGITQLQKSAGVQSLGVTAEKKLFGKFPVSATLTKRGESLGRIRVLSYASGEDPKMVADALGKDESVEYAEPYFVRRIFYDPDDPSYPSSWWLQKIQAAQAWAVTKGDTSVIIGIIDTGIQWGHPDLAANIKRNWSEIPNDGIDNDGNGYIDDVVGWDFGSANNYPDSGGSGDNNPDERTAIHGTHCAGIAAAVTDNGVGIASVGFNSKILPVKVTIDSDQDNGIYYGYEGILYAAERGAKIISCSWGGEGYSQAEQDIIDYVTEVKGALVFAAAGNGDFTYHIGYNIDDSPIYPAAYNNVFAVGATNLYDEKASFSNYGATACDLMAPGVGIWSTWKSNSYSYLSGTSMACPMMAGSAALVLAKFPNYTPQKIAEQLRATADNIDAKNPNYAGKLGKGRLNIYKAVSDTVVLLEVSDFELNDIDGDNYLSAGDTVSMTMTLKNGFPPVSGVNVAVTSQSTLIRMLQSSFTVSSLASLANYTDQSVRFVVVDGSVATNDRLSFGVTITADGGYVSSTTVQLANPFVITDFKLKQNYPNPFNSVTIIEYAIPKSVKTPVRVQLKVYDILGRWVKTLVDEVQAAGSYKAPPFNATRCSSGMYFYRIQAGSFTEVKKMVLVK
ncbi:MAG: S8 family serine peptidase [Chlorobiales bacterium]|nr:S8 family serine peptidase [Chlorobiales bacterium]